MQKLCIIHGITIIITNFTKEMSNNLDDISKSSRQISNLDEWSSTRIKDAAQNEFVKLDHGMGTDKHWYFIPQLKLFMANAVLDENSNEEKRFIQIWQSQYLKCKTGCEVDITNEGVI